MHWWHYYGKELYTLREREQVIELIEENAEDIFNIATVSFVDGEGPTPLLMAIRNNRVENLIQEMKNKIKEPLLQQSLPFAQEVFLEEIVKTYNQPAPDIPITKEVMARQIIQLKERLSVEEKLNSTKVKEIFKKCLLQDSKVKNNKLTSKYTMAAGVQGTVVFDTNRLNEQKQEINEMLDQIKDIEQGPHFMNLCIDRVGRLWTGDHAVIDQLMTLGLATELLKVPFDIPRESWSIFPEGLPYVMKDNEKVATPVKGNEPSGPSKKKKI